MEAVADAARRMATDGCCMAVNLVRDEDIHLAPRIRREVGYVDFVVHCGRELLLGSLETAAIADLDPAVPRQCSRAVSVDPGFASHAEICAEAGSWLSIPAWERLFTRTGR